MSARFREGQNHTYFRPYRLALYRHELQASCSTSLRDFSGVVLIFTRRAEESTTVTKEAMAFVHFKVVAKSGELLVSGERQLLAAASLRNGVKMCTSTSESAGGTSLWSEALRKGNRIVRLRILQMVLGTCLFASFQFVLLYGDKTDFRE